MNLLDRILIWLGVFYIWLVGRTSKVVVKNSAEYEALEKNKKPVIYAVWHGRQIFLLWSHRKRNVYLLISQSKDGGYIAAIVNKLGLKTVRGSSSKDGVNALVGMIKKGKEGFSLAFTPDGPRGPLCEVQPGVILAAQKTGLPIIPLASSSKRKFVVRNWDEFHIPYPFNKVAVCHGQPVYVSENDDIENKSQELKTAIDFVTKKADDIILTI
ncbi:MAG: lysophospholipid acyltransferase family protein [Elusimicrobiota bacterium]|nr:lysophospholipid acyltransferase family protein [Elusimicrobiota bacterium]